MDTILIVEDDPMQRELLGAIFRSIYQLVEAADVTEGIAVAHRHRPDLVLLDLNLQDHHDGLEVCRALRGDPDRVLAQVPIVIATGSTDREDIDAAMEAGADSYVSKPWKQSTLLALINRLLRKRHG